MGSISMRLVTRPNPWRQFAALRGPRRLKDPPLQADTGLQAMGTPPARCVRCGGSTYLPRYLPLGVWLPREAGIYGVGRGCRLCAVLPVAYG